MDGSTDLARGPDPLAALRAATHTRHEELDSGLPIGKEDASLADYASHLTLLRAWLAPLQEWLKDFSDGPQADPRFHNKERLTLLEADLSELGVPASVMPVNGAHWPSDAGPAWRWGVAYVVEGSQLGGTVLYGRLQARLAPHPLRYLKGNDGGPGPRWRAFMHALRTHVRSPEEINEACAGACAAFDGILALQRR